jgi:transposase-like protein
MQAIEAEVSVYINAHRNEVDPDGHRLVVRNGRMPKRTIDSGVGPIEIHQPRVNDRRVDEEGNRVRFASQILPRYLRRTKSLEEMVPWLYLKGISTGDFTEWLQKLTGSDQASLSPTTVVRLKETWQHEYDEWRRRSLGDKHYVYVWADGIYFNARLEGERSCILVLMGATADGTKELIAVQDGVRESESSWSELLLDLKARGLTKAPELATGDGALGFWKAVEAVFPTTRAQRCCVHKTANILDKLPKQQQPNAKAALNEIWIAATREEAGKALDLFASKYQAKYPKAVECLVKDRDELLAFYDFPAEHWIHLRTTNPIESTFATVRLRHRRTKGSGTREATLTMVFKLAEAAAKHWRRLTASQLLKDIIYGIKFKDGIRDDAA